MGMSERPYDEFGFTLAVGEHREINGLFAWFELLTNVVGLRVSINRNGALFPLTAGMEITPVSPITQIFVQNVDGSGSLTFKIAVATKEANDKRLVIGGEVSVINGVEPNHALRYMREINSVAVSATPLLSGSLSTQIVSAAGKRIYLEACSLIIIDPTVVGTMAVGFGGGKFITKISNNHPGWVLEHPILVDENVNIVLDNTVDLGEIRTLWRLIDA